MTKSEKFIGIDTICATEGIERSNLVTRYIN